MKNWYSLIIVFLSCNVTIAQNLVPNGDFEQFSGCPTSSNQIDSALFWMNPSINGGSPDYYNQCSAAVSTPGNTAGFQQPRSGVAYSGIFLYFRPNIREYIEVQLTTPLLADSTYQFEMYVNLANTFTYTTDAIGVYFSDTAITGINHFYVLPYPAQINNTTGNMPDTLSWTLVTGTYTAVGGENYLMIGNFKEDVNTTRAFVNDQGTRDEAYFFIDDVSLIQINSPPCPPLSLTYTIAVAIPELGNGAMRVVVSGGEPPYLYSLDSLTFQASNTFTSLALGNYQVYVTDSNGCTGQGTFTIDETNCNCTD